MNQADIALEQHLLLACCRAAPSGEILQVCTTNLQFRPIRWACLPLKSELQTLLVNAQ